MESMFYQPNFTVENNNTSNNSFVCRNPDNV